MTVDIARGIIAPLIDPAKVATLKGDRPANERLYKVLYWLEMARLGGVGIGETIDKAQVHLNIEKTVGGACCGRESEEGSEMKISALICVQFKQSL